MLGVGTAGSSIKNYYLSGIIRNSFKGPKEKHAHQMPKLRGYILDDEDSYDVIPLQKRAWNSINNAWGKRGSALRPMGWKREPARLHWNNLRGMWGKRSQPQSWNKIAPAYIN
ncbi:CLUMA_CG002272, isoform A [Clunio marinus]|uniref:CLUMA_CG002272, isoform A n=1 Tax=Clunio marinus TaxID=568069 RepID=A0A1J1HKG6_9DIPT|nr:CLUMA_CG002272, isoform A [Clunio marinus]